MTARLPDTHLQAALQYGAMGWCVFPAHSVVDGRCTCGSVCDSPGGHPRTQRGVKEANRTLSKIHRWSEVWEQSNIGIATGSGSGIFIVDVNPRNGGQELLDTLVARHGPLPSTLTASIDGGGRQYVFKQPPGFRRARKTLGEGIDILSDGDSFTVRPFVTNRSNPWLNSGDGPKASDVADAPAWLIALASGLVPVPMAATGNSQNSQVQTVKPEAPPEPEPTPATPPADGVAIINEAEPVEVVVPDAAPAVADSHSVPDAPAPDAPDSHGKTFKDYAERLADNGYRPVPVKPGTKVPAVNDWQNFVADAESIERFPNCSTGLLTKGNPVADIDVMEPEVVAQLCDLATRMLGPGLIRIGMAPKMAIVFRADESFSKLSTPEYRRNSDAPGSKAHKVEFLADGQQVVAFGNHPNTGKPYTWITESPLEQLHESLRLITLAQAQAFINAATELLDKAPGFTRVRSAPRATNDTPPGIDDVDDVTVAELRSALAAMTSHDRDLWQRMAHALKTAGPRGYGLFHEWSMKSPKYDPVDTERVWNSLHPDKTHWKAVFTEAQESGWLNPRKTFGPSGPAPALDHDSTTYSFELPDFPSECLYGIVGDVVKLATLNTEAGVPAVAFATIALFGAAAGRNAYIEIGDGTKHARAWGIIIGPTSTGRKGTSLELPAQLMKRAQEIAASKASGNLAGFAPRLNSMNGVATGEGLMFAIRDGTILMAGTRPRWDAVEDKRLLVIDEEFASTLAKCARKDATLSAILRKAWDGRTLDNPTKSEPLVASRPHIVMLSQITPDEFLSKTETVELMNGLINRFMLILTKRNRSVPIPTPAPLEHVEALAERLARVLSFAWNGKQECNVMAENGLKISLSSEAEALYRERYEQLTNERPGIVGGATGRMSTHVWIIAAIYAMLDECSSVTVEHMKAALGWAAYAFDCAALLFNKKANRQGTIEAAARVEGVFDKIRASGAGGITRTDLHAEFAGHIPASRLKAAIEELVTRRRISEESDGPRGGRPAKRYTVVQTGGATT